MGPLDLKQNKEFNGPLAPELADIILPLNPKKKKFKGLWFSDQHTLHNKTPTWHILGNMDTFIYKEHDLSDIDIVLFGGDLFDRLVDAADGDLRLVQHWIRKFLIKCHKYNVIVRVLEGTRSHDMEQPETFVVQAPEGLNLKWVKSLSVEFIPELDLSVMYVPDNMGHLKNEEIWELALTKLSETSLVKVDIIAFHGMWDFQAPPHLKHKFHQSEQWATIVNYIIFTGHVHIPSEYSIFRSSGSFDRVRHGEEHPKGGYEFEFNISEKYFKTKFWENKNALPYIGIKVPAETKVDELLVKANKVIRNNNLPPHSRINFKGPDGVVINAVVQTLSKSFPLFGFDIDTSETKKKLVEERLITESEYSGVDCNKDNLSGLLMDDLKEYTPEVFNTYTAEELTEVLKEFL